MISLKLMHSPRFQTLLLGCSALLIVLSIILFPERAFQSSLQGLSLWWKLVFPALLPFLIITEIVRGMGFLHALGILLEPLLRLLFRLPGACGWAIALGFTAGAPSAAIAAGQLRQDGLVTREEAERLLSLSHVANPIVLITVIGVGFFNNPQIGVTLAFLHYGSAIATGLCQRLVSPPALVNANKADELAVPSDGLLSRSLVAMHTARSTDGRSFGKLLGDSVLISVQHLMAVGGVMMMFSVLIHIIALTPVIAYASAFISSFSTASVMDVTALLSALLPGLLELHLGAYALGQSNAMTDSWQYAALSAMLAWGGLSAHAQVNSFTFATDIRYSAFMRSRLLHAAIAFVLALLLWKPLYVWVSINASPVFAQQSVGSSGSRLTDIHGFNLWPLLSPLMAWFSGILFLLLLLSVFTAFIWRHRVGGGQGSKR